MSNLYLVAAIMGHRLAFDTSAIQSVVDLGAITPAPRTPAHVAGLTALRSKPMTVIDGACSLDLAPQATRRAKGLVVERGGYLYALAVDEVDDVVWIADAVQPAPPGLPTVWQQAALGMIPHNNEMLFLADVTAMLDGPLPAAA